MKKMENRRTFFPLTRLLLAFVALAIIIIGIVLNLDPITTFGAGISTTIVILGILELIFKG